MTVSPAFTDVGETELMVGAVLVAVSPAVFGEVFVVGVPPDMALRTSLIVVLSRGEQSEYLPLGHSIPSRNEPMMSAICVGVKVVAAWESAGERAARKKAAPRMYFFMK